MKYLVAETFKSIQGEGLFTGTPMAFIRFVGCSVGKKVCHGCDTAFEKALPWQGGGEFTASELGNWAFAYNRVCLTGGEPLDQDLGPLFNHPDFQNKTFHIETSGTRRITFNGSRIPKYHLAVSPKPGWIEDTVMQAHEVKVIVPGLGSGDGWPTLEDAQRWADQGRTVFLQPRNKVHEIDYDNLALAQQLIKENPNFRLSVQMHKVLKVR